MAVPRPARLAVVRKQYHFWPASDGVDAWDVDRLAALSSELPVELVAIDDLPDVDSVYWFNAGQQPTVRAVTEHLRLVLEVDVGFPIILGPDNRVMDGMHRISRALLDGRSEIPAVRFRELPDPDHTGCRPEDLPT